ncbi:MAG: mannose-1-phosphate guanylyltransferase [Bacteroides sp.]|jgi:mannose-1-phosphate guanylyltransferase|nr:mannose-1-phosphate guanylyltransferase [Bacteroides sp.]
MKQLDHHNYAVILAGGIGERFWPMSRNYRPKQFIDILGTGKTLIQQTYERFLEILPRENIFVVTNAKFQHLVREQIPEIREDRVICEPTRKNTAPCIAYAAWKIFSIDEKARLVVAPSDHIILKEHEFARIIRQALQAATEHEWLFTLGITPSRPDTGYGYIQYVPGAPLPDSQYLKKVKTFTEKPSLELAESFLKSGDFLWNSGIFIWSANAIIEAFEKYQPEISYVFRQAIGKYNTPDEISYMSVAYAACKSISIDYAVMEKADNVYVFVSDFGWSDLGTWGSLYDVRPKDGQQNAVMGKNVILYDVSSSIVNIPDEKLVVLQGLDDYIVAESDNALLICQKDKEQEIRRFVNDIRLKKGEEFT